MLLPTQQAANTFITDMMRSMIERSEERRAEEEDKAKGRKENKQEDLLKAKIKPDETAKAANEKINAHFFGALKPDENPMAVLISRFADAFGLTQASDESSADFADRLQDALTLTDLVAEGYDVTLKTFRVSADNVRDIMKGNVSPEDSEMAKLAARIGLAAGVDPDDKNFDGKGGVMAHALTAARAALPTSSEDVERSTGLTDIGITAEELIEAIRRPWGETAMKVKAALDAKAVAENTMTKDMAKVIQRLEDVADPKTKEELQVERTEHDPTKVEDAETRQEREADIKALEAGEKMEDIQKQQEAIKEHNDQASETTVDGEAPSVDPMQLMQVLVAGAEAAKASDDATPATDAPEQADAANPADDGDPDTLSREEQIVIVSDHSPESAMDAQAAVADDITPVTVDEIGLYELLKKQKTAA